ncbi:hypothetical protein RJ639_003263, partial [Escallonia herrerae]
YISISTSQQNEVCLLIHKHQVSTMALKVLLATFLFLGMWASLTTSRSLSEEAPGKLTHKQWMARYGRVYKDELDEDIRSKVYNDNVEFIETFNKDKTHTYKLGVNAFADLTNEEFRSRNGYKIPPMPPKPTTFKYEGVTEVPPSIDWRDQGAVTAVKDQGMCGVRCLTIIKIFSRHGIRSYNSAPVSLFHINPTVLEKYNGIQVDCPS